MRRAISLLMMVIMVLAPCAVAHAASSASHHAGMILPTSSTEHDTHQHAVPNASHEHHAGCVTGDRAPDHGACSSNCDLLQRVALQNAGDRVSAEFEKSWATVSGVLSYTLLALEPEPIFTSRLRPIRLSQDSKSVLRTTARLRL